MTKYTLDNVKVRKSANDVKKSVHVGAYLKLFRGSKHWYVDTNMDTHVVIRNKKTNQTVQMKLNDFLAKTEYLREELNTQ